MQLGMRQMCSRVPGIAPGRLETNQLARPMAHFLVDWATVLVLISRCKQKGPSWLAESETLPPGSISSK